MRILVNHCQSAPALPLWYHWKIGFRLLNILREAIDVYDHVEGVRNEDSGVLKDGTIPSSA